MYMITDSAALGRALDALIDPDLRWLLMQRRNQLLSDSSAEADLGELVQFIVVEPCDAISQIEAAAGYPVVTSPAFEWVADHGAWYEAVTILSDDGLAVVLLVPSSKGVDPVLLSLLRRHALPGELNMPDRQQEERSIGP